MAILSTPGGIFGFPETSVRYATPPLVPCEIESSISETIGVSSVFTPRIELSARVPRLLHSLFLLPSSRVVVL